MDSLSPSGRRNRISKTSDNQLSLTALNSHRVGKLIERSLLPFAALVAVVLCVSEKPMQASFSVASAAAIMSEINRKRSNKLLQEREKSPKAIINNLPHHIISQSSRKFDSLYENQQQQFKEFNHIRESFARLKGELKQVTEDSVQLSQKIAEKNLDRTRLTHTIRKNHELQRQLQKLELGTIDSLSRDTEELKQQLAQIEQIIATQQQLTNSKPALSTSQNRNRVANKAKIPHRPADHRVLIVVDESNARISAMEQKCKLNFAKLLDLLKDKSTDCKAIAYIATDPQNKKQPAFLSRLKNKGFQIVSKPVVKRADGSVKGNLDMEIGLDLVNLVDSYDTAVLVSGDADFVCAVNQSRSYGKRVEVASFRTNTSKSLIKAADSYLNLETIIEQIC